MAPPNLSPGRFKPGNCRKIRSKTKQKRYRNTILFYFPKNHYVCKMIAVKKCHSNEFIAVCVVHFSLFAWISSFHTKSTCKEIMFRHRAAQFFKFAWLSFRKIYVLTTSLGKSFVQFTNIKFLPTKSQLNRFWDANFPPSVSLTTLRAEATFSRYELPRKCSLCSQGKA